LRPQSDSAKSEIAAALKANVWPILDNGTVKPIIHQTFPLSKAADAHALMESSEHIGKIMLVL
jgi:NADPH2:quinone reductase